MIQRLGRLFLQPRSLRTCLFELEPQRMASRATAKVVAVDAPVETIIPSTLQVVPASLFAAEPHCKQLGERGVVGSLVNAKGLRLACYYWPVRSQQALVLACCCGPIQGWRLSRFRASQIKSSAGL